MDYHPIREGKRIRFGHTNDTIQLIWTITHTLNFEMIDRDLLTIFLTALSSFCTSVLQNGLLPK
jgi:hypothetical protein